MKRDMDLIREILFLVESKEDDRPCWGEDLPLEGCKPIELSYHANMLAEAGFIVFEPARTDTGRIIKVLVFSLTWHGHEYLDTIRDPEIWRKTKEGAQKVGGFSLELMADLAKGLVKKKIKELTEVEIDL